MNVPVIQKMSLPAHLAALGTNAALMNMNTSAAAGISAGGWPRISIKGSRFRLQHPQGEEVVVPTLDLDVIIVDSNPNGLSKIWYAGAYDPSVEDKAPDCYSDNGVGASAKSAKPQSSSCATCPHNVWGSKINPSGSATKACADSKKVAVLIAGNPDGPVFELRIPPASLKNFALYIQSLTSRGIPAAAIQTKLTFDTSADFPKLLFTAAGWATEEQAAAVMEVIGTEEVDQCTGKNDVVIDPSRVGAAATSVIAAGLAPAPTPLQQFNAQLPPVTQMPAAPPVQASFALPPLPDAGAQSPQPTPPAAPLAHTPVPPTVGTPATAPAAKRVRKGATSTAAPSMAAPPAPAAAVPPFLANMPVTAAPPATDSFLAGMSQTPAAPPAAVPGQNAANATTPLNPPVTDSALNDMLARAMAT